MCRGKPQPDISILAPALPVLADILFQNRDIDTMVDATWALSYISDGEDMRIEAVLKTGVIPYLTNILRSDNVQAVVPSLRTLGNIVSGDDRQTQSVLDSNVLSALVPLLSHAKKNIRKETCWLLSNIAAGTVDQLTELVNTPSLLQRVLEQMSSTAEWDVRREACWVVSNVASVGHCAHIHNKLIEYGALTPLCELLTTADVKIVMVAMEALESILKLATPDTLKRYIQLIDEAGGIDNLENLQEHAENKVYKKASQIIIKYFGGGDDEDESENIAPATTQNNGHTTFAFGIDPVKWQAPLNGNGSNSNGSGNNGGLKQFNNNNSIMNQQTSGFSFGN